MWHYYYYYFNYYCYYFTFVVVVDICCYCCCCYCFCCFCCCFKAALFFFFSYVAYSQTLKNVNYSKPCRVIPISKLFTYSSCFRFWHSSSQLVGPRLIEYTLSTLGRPVYIVIVITSLLSKQSDLTSCYHFTGSLLKLSQYFTYQFCWWIQKLLHIGLPCGQ